MSHTSLRRPRTRAWLVAVAVGLLGPAVVAAPASAQTGCGGLLPPACPPPAPTPAPAPTPDPAPAPAPTPPPPPIDAASFAAIEAVMEQDAALSDARTLAGAQRIIRRFDARCRAVPRSNALLRAYRRSCTANVLYAKRTIADCSTPRGCARYADRLASSARSSTAAARALNRAATSAIADRDCRSAVRVPAATLRAWERFASAFREAAAGLRAGSPARVRRAQRRINAISDPSPRTPAVLRAFRANCR